MPPRGKNVILVDFRHKKLLVAKPRVSDTLTIIFLGCFVVFFWVEVLGSIF